MLRQVGTRGHHFLARMPLGPNKEKIGQCILVSDYKRQYHIRVILEPCSILNEIYILKLGRELVDALTYDIPIEPWDLFKDNPDVVFHVVYRDNRGYLFASDRESDIQFGVIEDVEGFPPKHVANLICSVLNGFDVDNFFINEYGEVTIQS